MMAFSQPHPSAMPPGMAAPGQHVGHMQPPNAVPPMGHPAAQAMPPQMHHAMPGPNPAHAPGPMMGGNMHPGMAPNAAHAMSHLQPQSHLFQNPQIQQQNQQMLFQQAQIHRQRMLQQQQAQAAAQHGNMPMAMMQQGPNPGINPQLHGMQQGHPQRPNIPPNIQQQLAARQHQQQQQQQQHQHQQQMLQQMSLQNTAPQVSNPGPLGPSPQAPAMRHQPSMQGIAEAQNAPTPAQAQQQPPQTTPRPPEHQPPQQHQPAPPPPPPLPQQQQPQQPPQPQQPHQTQPQLPPHSAPQHQAQSQQLAQQQQQQEQPPRSQPQQPQQAQTTQASRQPQHQAPNASSQQSQAQSQAQQTQQSSQQQLANNQRMQNMATQKMLLEQQRQQQQQQQQQQQLLQQQQLRNAGSTNALPRLLQMFDMLGSFTRDDADRIDFLQQFIMEFFTEDAILKGRLWDPNAPDKPRFEIPQSSVARYFQIQYQGGIERIFIATGGSTTSAMGNGRQLLHCPAGRFTYCYDTGTQLVHTGKINALFGPSDKFEHLEFEIEGHEDFLPGSKFKQMFASESPNLMKSPKMNKSNPKQKKPQNSGRAIQLYEAELPFSPVRGDGVTDHLKLFLEVAENFSRMRDLFEFAHQSGQPSANAVLQQFMEQQAQNSVGQSLAPSAQMAIPPTSHSNGFQQGPNQAMRNFTVNGPANALNNFAPNGNLGLPGPGHPMNSPHMRGGSPGHPNMHGMPMAQQMVAQHSQQGNSSSATASSNASPNAPSKKRRASAVKQEAVPDDGMQINGIMPGGPPDPQGKTKSTPKIGGKRQKANP